jgi:hypothetical protein
VRSHHLYPRAQLFKVNGREFVALLRNPKSYALLSAAGEGVAGSMADPTYRVYASTLQVFSNRCGTVEVEIYSSSLSCARLELYKICKSLHNHE